MRYLLSCFLIITHLGCLLGRPIDVQTSQIPAEAEEQAIYFELVFSELLRASHPELALTPYLWGPDDLTIAHQGGCSWLRNQSGSWETVDHLPPYQDTLSMSACQLTQTASGQLFLWVTYYVDDGQPAHNATHIHAVSGDVIDPQWHQAPLDTSAVTAITHRLIEDALLVAVLEPQAARWYQWHEADDAFQLAGNETLAAGQAIDLEAYPTLAPTDHWLLMADNATSSPLREWDGDQFVPFPEALPGPARSISGCAWGKDQCAWIIDIEDDASELWCWNHNHTTFELRTLLYGELPQHTQCIGQDEAGIYVWHVTSTESLYFRCPTTEPFVCERLVEDLPGGKAMAAADTTFALVTVSEDNPIQQELRLYVKRFGEPPVSPMGTLTILMPSQPRGVRDPIGSVNVTGTLTGTKTVLVPWESEESLLLPEGSYLLETTLFKKNGKPCPARFTSYPDGNTLEDNTVKLALDKETLVYVQYKCPRQDKSVYYALILLLLIYPAGLIKMGYDKNESEQENWAKDLSWWETLKWSFRQKLPPQPARPKATTVAISRKCKCCQHNSPTLNKATRLCNTCQCAHYHSKTERCTQLAVVAVKPDGTRSSLYYCLTHLQCQHATCTRQRRQPLVPFCDKHKCRTTIECQRLCLAMQYDYDSLCFHPCTKNSPYCKGHQQCQAVIKDEAGTVTGRCFRSRSIKTMHPTAFCEYHRCQFTPTEWYPCSSQVYGHGFCRYHFSDSQNKTCLVTGCTHDHLPFSPENEVVYPYCTKDTCQAEHIIENAQGERVKARCNQKAHENGFCIDHAATCLHCQARHPRDSLEWGMHTQCGHQCAALEYDADGDCRPCTAAVATAAKDDTGEMVFMHFCVAHLDQQTSQDSDSDDEDEDLDEDEGEEDDEEDDEDAGEDEDSDEDEDEEEEEGEGELFGTGPPGSDNELRSF